MLVNLMPPPVDVAVTLREPAIVVAPAEPERGFLVVHPRYKAWLAKCGLTTSSAVWNLPGEVVSGHPTRHVLQVAVRNRRLFLKREHVVGWKVRRRNKRAGFGAVSRSEREAKVLQQLEDAGLPGPHWVAYGEDGRGRAFLLVDELTGCRDLRDVLADASLSAGDRRTLAVRLGESLAALHAAGFDTPDLAAKHVLVRPGSYSPTVLDWQSAQPGRACERWESLATLDATLAEWLATPRERLRALRAYRRRMATTLSPSPLEGEGWGGGARQVAEGGVHPSPTVPTPHPNPPPQGGREQNLSAFARTIRGRSQKLLTRSSVRDQRQPHATTRSQRLVWLADEAVCAAPDIAKLWPRPAVCAPYYSDEPAGRTTVRLADDRPAALIRLRTGDWLGRTLAVVRGKPWRSPAAVLSRLFFHLEKAGVPVPRLYAFGQQSRFGPAESFLLHEPVAGVPLADWLAEPAADREQVLTQLGGLLRSVHDADCTLGSPAVSVVTTNSRTRLTFDPTRGAALAGPRFDRGGDLVALLTSLPLSADDGRRVLDGYAPPPDLAQRVLRKVVTHP